MNSIRLILISFAFLLGLIVVACSGLADTSRELSPSSQAKLEDKGASRVARVSKDENADQSLAPRNAVRVEENPETSDEPARVVHGQVEFEDVSGAVVRLAQAELLIHARSDDTDRKLRVPVLDGQFAMTLLPSDEYLDFEQVWDGLFRIDDYSETDHVFNREDLLKSEPQLHFKLTQVSTERVIDAETGSDLTDLRIYDGEPIRFVDALGKRHELPCRRHADSPFVYRSSFRSDFSEYWVDAEGYAAEPLEPSVQCGWFSLAVLDPVIRLRKAGRIEVEIQATWNWLLNQSDLRLQVETSSGPWPDESFAWRRIGIPINDPQLKRITIEGLPSGCYSVSIHRAGHESEVCSSGTSAERATGNSANDVQQDWTLISRELDVRANELSIVRLNISQPLLERPMGNCKIRVRVPEDWHSVFGFGAAVTSTQSTQLDLSTRVDLQNDDQAGFLVGSLRGVWPGHYSIELLGETIDFEVRGLESEIIDLILPSPKTPKLFLRDENGRLLGPRDVSLSQDFLPQLHHNEDQGCFVLHSQNLPVYITRHGSGGATRAGSITIPVSQLQARDRLDWLVPRVQGIEVAAEEFMFSDSSRRLSRLMGTSGCHERISIHDQAGNPVSELEQTQSGETRTYWMAAAGHYIVLDQPVEGGPIVQYEIDLPAGEDVHIILPKDDPDDEREEGLGR